MKSGSTKSETKVARLRCERGLTQAALAEKTGVNIRAIQRYESGERKIEGASLTVALRIPTPWASTRANLFEHTHEGPTLAITARAGPFSCYKGKYTWQSDADSDIYPGMTAFGSKPS